MNPTQLRRIAKKYGTPGVFFVGAVLLLHSLWRRKPLLLVSLGVLAIAAGLLLPMTCNQPDRRPVSMGFTPQAYTDDAEVADETSEEPFAFRVVDLGALPGGEISEGIGISEKGQVAGVSDVSRDAFHGFFWDGKMRDTGTLPGGEVSIALGVNDSGQVVGIGDDRQGMVRGFVWQNGKMRDIGHLGGGLTIASGINNRGGIVGLSFTKDYLGHAFVWQDGKMRDIGVPKGCDFSIAQDVNDSGAVVGVAISGAKKGEELREQFMHLPYKGESLFAGYQFISGSHYGMKNRVALGGFGSSESARAFAWKNGKFTELRGKRDETIATALNNKGQVVGADFSESGDSVRATLWESEQGKELPSPSGFGESFALDISDKGIVVGGAFNDEDITACGWKDGKAYDLNKLLPADSGWTLYFASSINAKGQIVGVGEHNGKLRAFLLDPK